MGREFCTVQNLWKEAEAIKEKADPGDGSAFDKRRIFGGVQDSNRQRMRSAITCGCSPAWMDSMATQIMR